MDNIAREQDWKLDHVSNMAAHNWRSTVRVPLSFNPFATKLVQWRDSAGVYHDVGRLQGESEDYDRTMGPGKL